MGKGRMKGLTGVQLLFGASSVSAKCNGHICTHIHMCTHTAAHRLLHSHDLNTLLTIMSSAAAKWISIGLALDFTKRELSIIANTPANTGPVQCLTDLLGHWLNRAPPQHKRATVEAMMEVLRSPIVVEETLAVELDQKMTYCKTRRENRQTGMTIALIIIFVIGKKRGGGLIFLRPFTTI